MSTSGLKATILEFSLPVRSYNSLNFPIGKPDLENIDIAFEIVFLSCLQAEIWILPVCRPPSWICRFRFGRTAFPLISLDSFNPKT